MDYGVNDPRALSRYLIHLMVYHSVVGTTGVKISVDYMYGLLNKITMTTLIIDNDFPYKDMFQIEYLRVPNGTSASTLPVLSTNLRSSSVALMSYVIRL